MGFHSIFFVFVYNDLLPAGEKKKISGTHTPPTDSGGWTTINHQRGGGHVGVTNDLPKRRLFDLSVPLSAVAQPSSNLPCAPGRGRAVPLNKLVGGERGML